MARCCHLLYIRRIYKKIEIVINLSMRQYQDIFNMAEETGTMTNNTYYQINKQKIQEQYAAKREDKLAYQIEYNLINRDKYLDYQKSYYESKKDEILRMKREKITCECGKLVSMGYMTAHKKTKKHCAFEALSNLTPEPSCST
jgi:hypothetical protein